MKPSHLFYGLFVALTVAFAVMLNTKREFWVAMLAIVALVCWDIASACRKEGR